MCLTQSVLSWPSPINSTIVYPSKASSCLNSSVGISWTVAQRGGQDTAPPSLLLGGQAVASVIVLPGF